MSCICSAKRASKTTSLPRPADIVRELVSLVRGQLKDRIEFHVIDPPLIEQIHAAAEPELNVSQWTMLPPRQTGRALELSASAIQQYENCPLAYKLRYDWRLPEEASAALQFGNAMHVALKAYFDGVHAGRAPDEVTLIACFLDEFGKAKITEPLQREMYEKNGREQLAALVRSSFANPAGEIVETERQFKVQIEGALVKGRWDRLDRLANGDVAIVDYKTGNPKTQDDANDSLQLSIYALAARALGHTPSSLVFINLTNQSAIESRRSPDELRAAELKIAQIAAQIEAGNFEPRPSTGCSRCCYQQHLPQPGRTVATSARRTSGHRTLIPKTKRDAFASPSVTVEEPVSASWSSWRPSWPSLQPS